jgi:hypothetical protein
MKRLIAPVALLMFALGAPPLGAQTAGPAASGPLAKTLGYFIGSWSCKGGNLKAPPMTATVTWSFALEDTLVDQHVVVPAAGKAPAYRFGGYASYEPKKKHIISVSTDEYGGWGVAWTGGWVGKALTFHDVANDDNMLGTAVDTKIDASTFEHARYAKNKVVFKVRCVKTPS